MLESPAIGSDLRQLAPSQLRDALSDLIPRDVSAEERVHVIEAGLRSPLGQSLRDAMARWIVDEIVPVERLVPESYVKWRPPVRDAMMFVVARLSPARLAPKLLEQIDLPEKTPAEERLLRLIARVPGLQKLGQVIARNPHLRPALRKALARLENGIRDVQAADMRSIIEQRLGPRFQQYSVRIGPAILKEASVSAVIRFSWRNPESGRREKGVFKVLKPHIPEYFAEDMDYLAGLADYFGSRHHSYGFPAQLIPDTFRKVRRLLRHEVNFVREQKTLVEAGNLYRNMSGVRVPRLIHLLCTPAITALSEERGIKITNAAARLPASRRRKIAEQLIAALIATPLLSAHKDPIFHGDPHAGNLLYDTRREELIIIDWALRERLSLELRRHLALLFLTVTLRDPMGACSEVLSLSQENIRIDSPRAIVILRLVRNYLDNFPTKHLPSPADAVRLLERVALEGIRFPRALIILSKVMVTLDGILSDIAGDGAILGFEVARLVGQHWISNRDEFRSPLMPSDWIKLQCSVLIGAGRLWLKGEQALLDRLLPANSMAQTASA